MIVTQNSSHNPALQIGQLEKDGYLLLSQPQLSSPVSSHTHQHQGYHHDGTIGTLYL